jgi:uncharacterized protein (DUF433 family)
MVQMARGQNKKSIAFRFGVDTITRLRARAQESGAPQTSLAERYIGEGLRLDEHPLLYFRDGAAGRRPAVLGTRLDVADIITTLRQNENSVEETAEYLDIPIQQVDAALRYYADYRDEVEALIDQANAIAERERERWQRQQEALA